MAKKVSTITAIDELELPIWKQLVLLIGWWDEDNMETMEMLRDAVENVTQDQIPYLQHPGTVFHVVKTEESELVLENIEDSVPIKCEDEFRNVVGQKG